MPGYPPKKRIGTGENPEVIRQNSTAVVSADEWVGKNWHRKSKRGVRRQETLRWMPAAEAKPEMLEELFGVMAEEGSLGKACHKVGLDRHMVEQWLEADQGRQEKYQLALTSMGRSIIESLEASLITWIQADVGAAFDADGKMKRITEFPPELRGAIQQLSTERDEDGQVHITGIRLVDKIRTASEIGSWLGLKGKENEQQGEGFANALLKALEERRRALGEAQPQGAQS